MPPYIVICIFGRTIACTQLNKKLAVGQADAAGKYFLSCAALKLVLFVNIMITD